MPHLQLKPVDWPQVGKTARNAGMALLNLLLPPRCMCCGSGEVPCDGLMLCEACRLELAPNEAKRCSRCGAVGTEASAETGQCIHCRQHRMRFETAFALGNYDGRLREAVLRMKHPREDCLTLALGELLARRQGAAIATWKPEVIMPVPMHWWRRIRRGTNSAELVAGRLARRLRIPVASLVLRRHRNTLPQVSLPPSRRRLNVRSAFRVDARYCDLQGARVLLVDDVLTTGATCSELASRLKQAGAAAVAAAVIARGLGH